jgi:hypothetical protein
MYCHLQDINQATSKKLCASWCYSLSLFFNLKMEAVHSSETSYSSAGVHGVISQKDVCTLYYHCCESPKPKRAVALGISVKVMQDLKVKR